MLIDEHIQFLIRCQFNAYCKKAIANRAAEIKRSNSKRWENEYYFEDLAPAEQERIQVIEEFFEDEVSHYFVDGRIISEQLLHQAIESLPENKRAVIHLYYFDNLTDIEISKMLNVPRRSVNHRRNSSLKKIKEFLEEHRHDKE